MNFAINLEKGSVPPVALKAEFTVHYKNGQKLWYVFGCRRFPRNYQDYCWAVLLFPEPWGYCFLLSIRPYGNHLVYIDQFLLWFDDDRRSLIGRWWLANDQKCGGSLLFDRNASFVDECGETDHVGNSVGDQYELLKTLYSVKIWWPNLWKPYQIAACSRSQHLGRVDWNAWTCFFDRLLF